MKYEKNENFDKGIDKREPDYINDSIEILYEIMTTTKDEKVKANAAKALLKATGVSC